MARKVEIDSKFLILAVALVIIASVGSAFTAYLMISGSNIFGQKDTELQQKQDIGPTYDIGDFTVNLAGGTSLRFIRTGIVLEVDDKSVVAEAERRKPQIRDRIISVLRRCTLNNLTAEDGLDKLKDNIIESINEFLISGQIVDVFFIDLVFQ